MGFIKEQIKLIKTKFIFGIIGGANKKVNINIIRPT